ncbi:hypothetical protein [Amphritea pacifica]|uniref:Uncharacterized protein n=1 Tax=Amphritea pacifica TaxID=2811233 RepID=A0ABS2WD93_9GAMM|nr:hypothetical protein [Amphritea pacifica]MBN0989563.1 hypothetical protein [Amphritea pacifica]
MTELILFMVESAIVNSVAMIPSMLLLGYISSPFLINVGANKWVRAAVYSVFGVGAGVWSYSSFDVPDRSLEFWELIVVSTGMFILCLMLVLPIVLFKNRTKT